MAFLSDVLFGASWKVWVTLYLPIISLVYWVCWIVYARTLHPLARVPGAFWPSVSRTWLMWQMHAGEIEKHTRALHEQYGPIIRIAPDEVSVSDPECISKIYPIQRPLRKTDWYLPWRPSGLKSQPDLFTQTDEKVHSAYRRTVGGVYALSNILKNEPEIDGTLDMFCKRMDEFAEKKEAFDFGLWLEMYAYDNVGNALFGKAFGFVENSIDYGGYIHAVHLAMPFLSVVTMTPSYARPFLLVVAAMIPSLLKAVLAVEDIKKTAIRETKTAMERTVETTAKRPDVLSQLLAIVQDKGEKVGFSHREIESEMWVGVMAGADSTSIAMRSIFYFLMKNPEKLNKVRAEIDAAFENGTLSHPAQYSSASTLPYLSAVVREATRLFPAFQVTMPRTAPQQGIELCGQHIPANFKLGMNPAVVHLDKGVFGADASDYNPERWLESEDRTRAMDKAFIGFGAGTRQCTGRPLAMAQIFKIVSEVLRRYNLRMAHDRPWKTHNAAFNMQSDVICFLEKREDIKV